jgi:pyruvate dehydrogenase E1 component beta subunit
VPDGEYAVPLGLADIRREGSDVTIVAIGYEVGQALEAAEKLAADGISAEVIDPRSLQPLDLDTILASVAKTGRLVLVDQATRHGSFSSRIAADVAEFGFEHLKAPIKQVTALDATIAYSEPMEQYLLPNPAKIVDAAKQVVGEAPVAA